MSTNLTLPSVFLIDVIGYNFKNFKKLTLL
jgi:hypothetical protein